MSAAEPTAPSAAGSSADEELEALLRSYVGSDTGDPEPGFDPVNQPMIRHWVEAMGDFNPVYVDEEAATANGFPGVIAPPTMLQAWIMRGLRLSQQFERARDEGAGGEAGSEGEERSATDILRALDRAGYTSVVATNCDQHYERPLVLGDVISVRQVLEAVSPEKATGLGVGRFVTNRLEFTDQSGELVATMKFRILKFKPGTGKGGPPADQDAAGGGQDEAPARPLRPRPALTQDTRFFFEGAKQHKLLIQRCTNCGTLRHPPRPSCAACRSFDWDTVTSSGRGSIYSFTVNHHPKVPAFDYPLVVALVELEEGTRLVANVEGITPETVRIGMPVQATFRDFDDELSLPVFRPADDG